MILSQGNWFLEVIHAEADKAENGHLLGGGGQWQLAHDLNLQASLSYVDGPFNFEPIVYSKVKAIWSLPVSGFDVFVEVFKILQEQNINESRSDQLSVGISFTY